MTTTRATRRVRTAAAAPPSRSRTELRRQASRAAAPRSRWASWSLLPLIVLIAFEFGGGGDDDGNGGGAFASLVDLATAGGANFALFTLLVSSSFLLVVVVALFFGDTVASEASWGSLRYLLAIPVPRARLLGVKLIVSLLYSAAGAGPAGRHRAAGRHAALRLASAAVAPSPTELAAGDGVLRLARRSLGYIGADAAGGGRRSRSCCRCPPTRRSARSAARCCCRSCPASSTRSTRWARIRNFLPTHYSDAWLGLLSTPIQTDDMVRGAISALIYATIFFGLAFWRFTRKDVILTLAITALAEFRSAHSDAEDAVISAGRADRCTADRPWSRDRAAGSGDGRIGGGPDRRLGVDRRDRPSRRGTGSACPQRLVGQDPGGDRVQDRARPSGPAPRCPGARACAGRGRPGPPRPARTPPTVSMQQPGLHPVPGRERQRLQQAAGGPRTPRPAAAPPRTAPGSSASSSGRAISSVTRPPPAGRHVRAAAGRRTPCTIEHARSSVSSGPSSPVHVVLAEVGEVGVHVHEDVAGGDLRAPSRAPRPCRAANPVRAGCRRGGAPSRRPPRPPRRSRSTEPESITSTSSTRPVRSASSPHAGDDLARPWAPRPARAAPR